MSSKVADFTELTRVTMMGADDFWLYFQSEDGLTDYKVAKSSIFPIPSTPAQITSSQNNYVISNDADVFRISTDASRNITGIAGGWDGRKIKIINVGSFQLNLVHQSGSSDAANRIIMDSSLDANIAANSVVDLIYDGTTSRWRLTYGSYNVAYS